VSGFGISENPVDKRSGKSIVKTPIQIRTVHLLGQVAGIENHRHIESLETKSLRPFESRNNERITVVDPRKDTCRVIIQIGDSVIGTHISECFGFAVDEVRDLIRTVHPFGTRVGKSKKTGFGRFADLEDRKHLHFRIAKSEIPKGGKLR
jgi:hypothetical protein